MKLELWDICASRHRGSPESVAANKRASFTKLDDREAVFAEVDSSGQHGVTLKEVARKWGRDMNQISGRFTELRRDKRITKTTRRREGCAVYIT